MAVGRAVAEWRKGWREGWSGRIRILLLVSECMLPFLFYFCFCTWR